MFGCAPICAKCSLRSSGVNRITSPGGAPYSFRFLISLQNVFQSFLTSASFNLLHTPSHWSLTAFLIIARWTLLNLLDSFNICLDSSGSLDSRALANISLALSFAALRFATTSLVSSVAPIFGFEPRTSSATAQFFSAASFHVISSVISSSILALYCSNTFSSFSFPTSNGLSIFTTLFLHTLPFSFGTLASLKSMILAA